MGNVSITDDTPYENLRDAIVTFAVQDYYKYIREMNREYKKGNITKSKIAFYRAKDCKQWFLSSDFEFITSLNNGEHFAELMEGGITQEEKSLYNYWEGILYGNT